MKLYAVTGNPISHSLSPSLFKAAFQHTGYDGTYLTLAADTAAEAIHLARSVGLKGLNVTSPFKEEIIPHLDSLDPVAKILQAVNTVLFDGTTRGYNTDVAGVQGALSTLLNSSESQRIFILGAGGAAKAAVCAVQSLGYSNIKIFNRQATRAQILADLFKCQWGNLKNLEQELSSGDLLISCLPLMSINKISLPPFIPVLDACYTAGSLISSLSNHKGPVEDGRKWLLYQALAGYRLFTKREAPKSVMNKALMAGAPKKNINLALIGFMGAGKTTVGTLLAKQRGLTFIDTDQKIEEETGLSISEIFAQHGEKYFRNLEKKIIARYCQTTNSVVSLGGGAILDPDNRKIIRSMSQVVWLWVNPQQSVIRTQSSSSRPLLKKNALQSAQALLEERMDFYSITADLIIDTSNRQPKEIAIKISNEMDYTNNSKRDS